MKGGGGAVACYDKFLAEAFLVVVIIIIRVIISTLLKAPPAYSSCRKKHDFVVPTKVFVQMTK